MTKEEKLKRAKKAGYSVRFYRHRTFKYLAKKEGFPDVEARSVSELNRILFGYN